MDKTTRKEIEALCEMAKVELMQMAMADFVDPEAPPGQCRPEFAESEFARRGEQVRRLITDLIATIESRFGAASADVARKSVEPLLSAFTRLH